MEAVNKIIKCSICGEAFIAGMVNGKQLKNCRICRDKKYKRKTPSETQDTERSQPPSDDEPSRIIPTFASSENHYSNMPLCRPDLTKPSPEKPSKNIKQLLTDIYDNLTNNPSNTSANEMLNDIANRLTVIEADNYVKEFIEYQKQQNEEINKLLNLIHSAIG